MARKKKHHEEHENHERWLVSYADFITLLFAFFVVMYSVSRVDNKKLATAANAIKWALHYEGTGGVGQLPIFEGPPSEGGCMANSGSGGAGKAQNSTEQRKAIAEVRKRMERRLKQYLMEQKDSSTVTIHYENNRLAVRIAARRFFDPSHAALRPEALPVLDVIASELATLQRPIRVEGHTDDSAFASTRYRNNWDLSSARAATVVSFLEEAHHISADSLTAAGLASSRPLVPNDSPEHREMNRRVELVVELAPQDVLNVAVRPSVH